MFPPLFPGLFLCAMIGGLQALHCQMFDPRRHKKSEGQNNTEGSTESQQAKKMCNTITSIKMTRLQDQHSNWQICKAQYKLKNTHLLYIYLFAATKSILDCFWLTQFTYLCLCSTDLA